MGSGGSYYIAVDEVQNMDYQYLSYNNEVQKALESIGASVDRVVGLDTFQGASAQSVKDYFQEVHYMLVDALNKLSKQLKTDFEKEYAPGFFEAPVSAGAGACLPEKDMKQVEEALRSMVNGDLSDADEYVKKAMSCLPSGVSFSAPNSAVSKALLEGEEDRIRKIREGVRSLEDKGLATLHAEDGVFSEMASSLAAAIAACASGSIPIAAYTSGGFNSVVDSTGLRAAYLRCVNDQTVNRDKVMQAEKNCLDRETIRIKEAEAKALQQKKTACLVGTILSVAVFVAAAAAMVATAGAATPLIFAVKATVAGAAVWTSMNDVADRTKQAWNVVTERDPLADKREAKDEALKGTAKTGKYIGKTLQAEHDVGNSGKLMKDATDMRDSFIKEGINQTFSEIGKATGNDKAEAYVEATGEVVGEAWSQFSERARDSTMKFDNSHQFSVLGSACKAGEAIADYYANEADQKLEDLNNQSQTIEEIRAKSDSGSMHTWSAAW